MVEPPPATLYGNPDGGGAEGWSIYDANPPGATITSVWDGARQSHVIELSGSGKDNGYRLQTDTTGKPWHNQELFTIEWCMSYSENFTVYIQLKRVQVSGT
jgi:hypothetical protein